MLTGKNKINTLEIKKCQNHLIYEILDIHLSFFERDKEEEKMNELSLQYKYKNKYVSA